MKKEKYNNEGYADLTAYSAIRNTSGRVVEYGTCKRRTKAMHSFIVR